MAEVLSSCEAEGNHPLSTIRSEEETTNGGDGDDRAIVAARALEKSALSRRITGRFRLRGKTDDLPQDWWFASTAIPLLAATIGPLANVLSIAALVTKWRVRLPDNGALPLGTDDNGEGIPDPEWELILNAISLALGFIGNLFLLLNFTRRIRYIVALPATIICWYFATAILVAIIICVNQYEPPIRPGETYSQGFWYAIIAAVLYMIGSMILMVNMWGYFLGHYPQHFELDDDQRTLILQTMMFFFWLAGGAAVFARVCGFTYANALYFCDVTVLTIGFGDLVPTNDTARGLIFPYTIIGIIFLGLMINSIRKFASSMSQDKVVRKHQQNEQQKTFGRTVSNERELRDRLGLPPVEEPNSRRPSMSRRNTAADRLSRRASLEKYGHFESRGQTIVFREKRLPVIRGGRGGAANKRTSQDALDPDVKARGLVASKGGYLKRARRREKLIVLRKEKDRFNAMRDIQRHTSRFKQYFALSMSLLAFGMLWCIGAAVFMIAESRIQGLTYFQSLYFCYVSLLTIGYGDFSPKSNAGRPFFVVWSLVAIPTMTILISEMSDTVVSSINRGTFTLADWTIMPKEGVWRDFLETHPKIKSWLERKTKELQAKERLKKGFTVQDPDEEAPAEGSTEPGMAGNAHSLERLADQDDERTEHDLARMLAISIKKVANDLRAEKPKKYGYEEWVEFTRLIRFSRASTEEVEDEEEEEGLIEWDWIGEDSPMLADVTESEWILDRLCESLNRYTRRQARSAGAAEETDPMTPTIPDDSDEKDDKLQSCGKQHPEHPAHPCRRYPRNSRHHHHHHLDDSSPLSTGSLADTAMGLESYGVGESRRLDTSSSGDSRAASGSGRTAVDGVDDQVRSRM